MTQIAQLLAANDAYAASYVRVDERHPMRSLAVVTCMDARIDVFAALGLHLGDAHVIRNAGGRVTDDVLRSLAVSTNLLNVDTVVLMQHTECGIEGVTEAELQERSGANVDFLPIDNHAEALRKDVDLLTATPFLRSIITIAGLVFDMKTGRVDPKIRWER